MLPMLPSPLPPIALGLRLLPTLCHESVLIVAGNHLLQEQPICSRLDELEGVVIALHISDCATTLCLRIRNRRLERCAGQPWDVRMSGRLEDFWQLARRTEDADTLFFNRRLSLEGDTERGLYLKNLLDALEFDWKLHLQAVLGARVGRRLHRDWSLFRAG